MMSKWQKVKIGDFLFERKGKYKPTDEIVKNLKRIEKIDFSGKFHISEKSSRTNMILIKTGDLVISGINVTKGAMGIYNGVDDISATIHYSSYTFDKRKINLGYFKRFLKSETFIELLKEQVKGGIKTEIKPKHILPLEIFLPSIEEQNEVEKHFERSENEIHELFNKITTQKELLKKLKQSVLQDSISGKLTKEWRKANPDLISGEHSAENLLAKIKAEKEQLIKEKKIKKQKPLPPIKEAEIPFELPDGWLWCRLGEAIQDIKGGGTPSKTNPEFWNGNINWASVKDLKNKYLITTKDKITDKGVVKSSTNLIPAYNLIISTRMGLGKIAINKLEVAINQDLKAIFLPSEIITDYFYDFYLTQEIIGSGMTVNGIRQENLLNMLFPLPPLAEQKAIVEKVEKLFKTCDELEKQINKSEKEAELLMQSVLREAFNK